MSVGAFLRRTVALAAWAYLVWTVLTWTRTAEQIITGAGISLAVGAALAPLGEVPGPWVILRPRTAWGVLRLAGLAAVRIVVANLRLSRRIWLPSRPLHSGMVLVPTRETSDGGLTTVALLTSVIVDNQLVDLDPGQQVMQYHAVAVPSMEPERNRDAINGPVERVLEGMEGGGDE